MDQRLLLAIALSIVVIFGYYTVFPPPPPKPKPTPAEEQAATTPGEPTAGTTATAPAATAVTAARPALPRPEEAVQPARQIVVETPRYVARLDTRGATLVSLRLKDYRKAKAFVNWGDIIPPLRRWIKKPAVDLEERVEMVKRQLAGAAPLGLEFVDRQELTTALRRAVFSADRNSITLSGELDKPQSLTLTGSTEQGLTVRKILTFHPDSYVIDYEAQVINYGKAVTLLRVVNLLGEGPTSGQGEQRARSYYGPMYREDGSVDTEAADKIEGKLIVREPEWLGITSNYFITAAKPEGRISHGEFRTENIEPQGKDEKWVASYGMELPAVELAPENMIASKMKLYMGPKKNSELVKFGDSLEESLDLTLDVLASPLLVMLRWFHGLTGNYGFAIILLTMVVRIVLFPLTYKGMVSMKRMSKLQPKIKAMREKYKDNKEKINREMMGMYKKYKVNPLGGCLPIAFQIPVFFALYSALLGAIELRHSPFLGWITDLSSADPLYVTPLLMGASMFFQQRMTPTAMDPTQQKILMWMPVIFTAFMFNFPAGLVLYWLTSNMLSVLQQMIINRVQIPDLVERNA